MAVSHKLLGIVESGELVDIPVESDPIPSYIASTAEVKLFCSDLPA